LLRSSVTLIRAKRRGHEARAAAEDQQRTNMMKHILERTNLVTTQLLIALLGGAIIVAVTFYSLAVIDTKFREDSIQTSGALDLTQIQEDIDTVFILGLSSKLDGASAGDINKPIVPVPRAILGHDTMQDMVQHARTFDDVTQTPESEEILQRVLTLEGQLNDWLAAPTNQELDTISQGFFPLRELTQRELIALREHIPKHQQELHTTVFITRWTTLTSTITLIVVIAGASVVIGRRLRRAAEEAQREGASLTATTSVLQRRNEQFGALYQVMSEVTESLNMDYVVGTAIRETKLLMGADIVSIRRLVGVELEVAEVATAADEEIPVFRSLKLGDGLVGRAAKRGRTIIIEEHASQHMAPEEYIADIASGMVVPLIVGARVVGTLSCWSHQPNHFTPDDQRILEMMASQVATAISAAGLHQDTQEQASHDALTALPNRRQLAADVAGPLAEAIARGEKLAVGMADIDHFKRFNDEFGHLVGDVTLQKVAEVLRSAVRDGDVVYRFGGEEFLIIFAGAGPSEALSLGERLRAAVERTPLTGESLEPVGPVTISLGLAICPDDGTDLTALIDIADRAMYASKEAGRNRVTLASSGHVETSLAA
jgi:diguanylate cyclase (GGDEF)-like protein